MQSVSSRIWTRVAVSISYDDNRYTTGTSYSRLVTHDWSVKNDKKKNAVGTGQFL